MAITLSEEQRAAAEQINDFINTSSEPYMVMHGLAGCGKTTILSAIAQQHATAIMCAFTGKAASVLRAKTALDTFTLHHIIYDFKGFVKDKEDEHKRHPVFAAKHEIGDLEGQLVLLDECSTVGTRLANDLLRTGVKLVACGDPGQLRPVRDSQFFNAPHILLREIHRQAWDSPIIRQAHSVRNSGGYVEDGDGFRVLREMDDKLLTEHDITLCWKNVTRQWLNRRHRSLLGFTDTKLRAGEPLMCLRNDHALKIYNGAIYRLTNDRNPGENLILEDDQQRRIEIHQPTIETIDDGFNKDFYENDYTPLALAYACTVHKFQGSEDNNILLIDEYRQAEGRRSYLYTGITRAVKRVTVVRRW